MAGLIRVLSTTTIRPGNGVRHRDFNRRIDLTPNDLQMIWFDYMHRGLFFEKPNKIPLEHLKATLSQALDRLYPLTGRLVATEHDGDTKTASFHIQCNGDGAKFVHSEALNGVTMAYILDQLVVPMETLNDLFPMTGVLSHQAAGSDLPLLVVQVTEFADGVYVAVSLNHGVADGTTLWDFFNVWSELARGDSAAISGRGSFVFVHVDVPVRIPVREPPLRSAPGPLQQRVIRFSKTQIAELKTKTNSENSDCGGISSLQAVMAHLWVCVTRARALRDGETVGFMTPVGMRWRLLPPLPESYVGNAVAPATVTCEARELLGRGTGWAARRINEAITEHDSTEMGKFFDDCTNMLASPPPHILPNIVAFTDSPRFDVYGNDFGWGSPVALRSGLAGSADGRFSVSPGAVEGSVDFEAVLSAGTFEALAADPEFTRYSS